MYLLIGTRGLVRELVAREIEDLEPLVTMSRVHALKVLILRGETTSCRRVDDEEHLALILLQGNIVAIE